MRRLAALFVALLCFGCAENAFLELQIQLPPNPPPDGVEPDAWFAQVQVRRAAPGNFGAEWQGGDVVSGVALRDVAFFDCISVEGSDEDVDLQVRVRFCPDIECAQGMARRPERFFEIEHPFYIGARTRWRTTIDRLPECTTDSDCGGLGVCVPGDSICSCTDDSQCTGAPNEEYRCSPETGAGGTIQTCVRVVDYCDVQGCLAGMAAAGFCDDEGNHECTKRSDDVDPMMYACPVTGAP